MNLLNGTIIIKPCNLEKYLIGRLYKSKDVVECEVIQYNPDWVEEDLTDKIIITLPTAGYLYDSDNNLYMIKYSDILAVK